jgi:hypothetical protein
MQLKNEKLLLEVCVHGLDQVVSTDDLGYSDGGEGNTTASNVGALFLSLLFGAPPQPPILCKDCQPTCNNDSSSRPKRTANPVSA